MRTFNSVSLLVATVVLVGAVGRRPNRLPLASAGIHGHQGPISQSLAYPASEQTLLELRDRGDLISMRLHAWSLLLYLTSAESEASSPNYSYNPAWATWVDKCTVQLATGNPNCPPAVKKSTAKSSQHMLFQLPVQLEDNQTNSPSISAVRYSPVAAGFILDKQLYSADGLTKLEDGRTGQQALVAEKPFPRDSVVVKEIWATISSTDSSVNVWDSGIVARTAAANVSSSRCQALGYIENGCSILIGSPTAGNSHWWSVTVNRDPHVQCLERQYRFTNEVGYDPARDSVPISCFEHISIPIKDLPPHRGNIFGPQASVPAGQMVDLVLVGVHIITAEVPDWVWTTFWWTNQPDADQTQADRPLNLKKHGAWSFYSMDTTMSSTTPADPSDRGPRVIFNPYLEGEQPNGPVSNCIYCHRMAVYRKNASRDVLSEITAGHPRRCAFFVPITDGCKAGLSQDSYIAADRAYFEGATATHFLWSLAVAQDAAASNVIPVRDVLKIPILPGSLK